MRPSTSTSTALAASLLLRRSTWPWTSAWPWTSSRSTRRPCGLAWPAAPSSACSGAWSRRSMPRARPSGPAPPPAPRRPAPRSRSPRPRPCARSSRARARGTRRGTCVGSNSAASDSISCCAMSTSRLETLASCRPGISSTSSGGTTSSGTASSPWPARRSRGRMATRLLLRADDHAGDADLLRGLHRVAPAACRPSRRRCPAPGSTGGRSRSGRSRRGRRSPGCRSCASSPARATPAPRARSIT